VTQLLANLFTIAAGISNPLQLGSNSALLKAIHSPLVAAFIVYAIGTLCLLACVPFIGLPVRESLLKLSRVPWWVYIVGICNALFPMSSLLITRKLGSATFTTTPSFKVEPTHTFGAIQSRCPSSIEHVMDSMESA
jgi:bacterial/archaeal transporter family-2 protein